MNKLAVLLTCFNRKEKTLQALKCVYQAQEYYGNELIITIYLTDDGSTDGTATEVKKQFPQVNILNGTGTLFWAEGMRKSWQKP